MSKLIRFTKSLDIVETGGERPLYRFPDIISALREGRKITEILFSEVSTDANTGEKINGLQSVTVWMSNNLWIPVGETTPEREWFWEFIRVVEPLVPKGTETLSITPEFIDFSKGDGQAGQ